MEVVRNKRAFFAMCAIIMSLNLFAFTDTILADHLGDNFGMSPSAISLVYASNTVGFLMTTLIAHKFADRFDCVSVMLVALVV